jgi:hypothetical protein
MNAANIACEEKFAVNLIDMGLSLSQFSYFCLAIATIILAGNHFYNHSNNVSQQCFPATN